MELELRAASGTIARLSPTSAKDGFSFVPIDGDFGINRTFGGFAGLGDMSLKVRPAGVEDFVLPTIPYMLPYPMWTDLSTASGRPDLPAVALQTEPWEIAAHNISNQLDRPPELPIHIVRRYIRASDAAGGVIVTFTITNAHHFSTLEIGGLGIPLVFQGRWDGLSLPDMARKSAFTEFYVGGHHGFTTVTRFTGRDEVLLMIPENGTFVENWRPNRFDGSNAGPVWTPEWLLHSKGIQEVEWQGGGDPWNPTTSRLLGPQASFSFGFRLLLAPNLRKRDAVLASVGRAVVHGVPGYVLATDMTSAGLLVRLPAGSAGIEAFSVDPDDALDVGEPVDLKQPNTLFLPVRGLKYGRARLLLQYQNAGQQAVHYFVLPPFKAHVDGFGAFQASKAWLDPKDTGGEDPFGRSHSVMPWDRKKKRHVLHDPRPFVVGLSDEAGAAANVGLAIKTQLSPTREEASRVDEYIHRTLWGIKHNIPYPTSLQDHKTGGIRASMFWVATPGTNETAMPGFPYIPTDTAGWIWSRDRAGSLGRAYNYPHQTIVYWSMYRLCQNHDLLQCTAAPLWYLQKAAFTIKGMWTVARWYTQFGLMAGTVFREVLRDLQLEGLDEEAAFVEEAMYNRTAVGVNVGSSLPACPDPPGPCDCKLQQNSTNATLAVVRFSCSPWIDNPFPFGSEFAWDSTGQEEIYVWGKYFNYTDTALLALDAILAFMPTMPNWGYNGAAFGIGDFSNNAKYTPYGGWERVLQHYRAGLNAIPALEQYRSDPDDVYLLLTGLGAVAGQLTNIDLDGATSVAFHSDPAMMKHDPYSGDYGVGFFGTSTLSAAYLLYNHFGAGWLCFLCNIISESAVTERASDAHAGPPSHTTSAASPTPSASSSTSPSDPSPTGAPPFLSSSRVSPSPSRDESPPAASAAAGAPAAPGADGSGSWSRHAPPTPPSSPVEANDAVSAADAAFDVVGTSTLESTIVEESERDATDVENGAAYPQRPSRSRDHSGGMAAAREPSPDVLRISTTPLDPTSGSPAGGSPQPDNDVTGPGTGKLRRKLLTAPDDVVISPRDLYHRRVYIEPLGLYLIAETGVIATVGVRLGAREVNVTFSPLGSEPASVVRLRWEMPAKSRPRLPGLAIEDSTCVDDITVVRGAHVCQPPGNDVGVWMLLTWLGPAR